MEVRGPAASPPNIDGSVPAAPATRREFVLSVSAATAGLLAPRVSLAESRDATVRRGLASTPGDFLFEPGLTYLQTGSLGPTPVRVMEQVMAHWRELERNPTHYAYGAHEVAMEEVRAKVGAFVGAARDEIVLTGCTTDGMNLVASGLSLERGDHVLTTDQEHPGGRSGWEWLQRTRGIVLEDVPIPPGSDDPRPIIDAFARRLSSRTKVVMCSHVLTSTGYRMPVAEIAALARAHGAHCVVDGAQAAGGIVVDVKALGCDAYVAPGHKWMLGPKGTGFLYLSSALGDRVLPVQLQAGRAAYSASNGVRSLPSVLGLAGAIDYTLAIGRERIEREALRLAKRVHEGVQELARTQGRGLRVVSAPPGPHASPLVTYELPASRPAGEWQRRLHARHGVYVKVVPANFLNGHRISTHLFNTDADVDRLLAALRTELD